MFSYFDGASLNLFYKLESRLMYFFFLFYRYIILTAVNYWSLKTCVREQEGFPHEMQSLFGWDEYEEVKQRASYIIWVILSGDKEYEKWGKLALNIIFVAARVSIFKVICMNDDFSFYM